MGNTILTFNEIIDLNHILEEKGISFKVHLHDRCGSQSFTVEPTGKNEQPIDYAKNEILDYFNKKRITLKFSEDNQEFRVI